MLFSERKRTTTQDTWGWPKYQKVQTTIVLLA